MPNSEPAITNVLVYLSRIPPSPCWCADLIYEDGGVWHKFIKRRRLSGVLEKLQAYGIADKAERL